MCGLSYLTNPETGRTRMRFNGQESASGELRRRIAEQVNACRHISLKGSRLVHDMLFPDLLNQAKDAGFYLP